MRLYGVSIETPELADACRDYGALLDAEPIVQASGARRFVLESGTVDLAAGESGRSTVLFAREGAGDDWAGDPGAFHGLAVRVDDPPLAPPRSAAGVAIDHVVVFTPSPERAIGLWRDRLGLRLAFDKEFEARKIRLMFFRSGGLTFEFACALPAPADGDGPDRFYGVSYRVRDLASRRTALLAAGFDVSELRPGNKAGTRVASVRSRTAGVPTLLLEDERPRPGSAP
jgi:catechol 2,3-dioxygenase-like lactoylglutathione lyase family enzyme